DLIVTGVQTCALPISRHGPERARGESEVEQPVPEGPELAERAILKVDEIPAVEEEACDEGCREEARDHVLAPDRLRSHAASFPHHARFGFAAYTRREATSERRLDGADVSCITVAPRGHAAERSRSRSRSRAFR